MDRVYLDYNATAPVREEVKEAILPLMNKALNPSSVHTSGREARAIMEMSRREIKQALGALDAELIFTASGTEANHLAVLGSGRTKVAVSSIEHPSVGKVRAVTNIISVDDHGIINLGDLEKFLKEGYTEKALICVMLANNETGAIQPIQEVVDLARQYGAYVHVDAVQAFGKIPVDFAALGADFMSVSAHKLGGSAGAAALIVRKGIDVKPQLLGGGQEKYRRAGTENVLAIHGFGVVAKLAIKELEGEAIRQQKLRDSLEQQILNIAPEAVIFSKAVKRLPNTSAIAMPGTLSQTQLIRFDLEGVEVSAGSACSSGKVEVSNVLQAMHVKHNVAETMVRVSLGKESKKKEVERFVAIWRELYAQGQQQAA